MILFENLTIAVEKEGDIFRAYAFNAVTEQNIKSVKYIDRENAITALFHELGNEAVQNDSVNT